MTDTDNYAKCRSDKPEKPNVLDEIFKLRNDDDGFSPENIDNGCEYDLDKFVLNDEVAEMESKMQNDQFILEGLALQGQMTVIYAKPNAGKTLLVMYLLIDATKSGRIDGSKIYYINADDHYKGLIEKIKLANEAGFKMLAPGHLGFKTEKLQAIIKGMVKKDTCGGVVVILDTVKKFTDLMNKTTSSEFFEVLRGFVSKGGTAILLAHVNKKRDEDKKVIFGGTSDLVDDADCAYTLDEIAFDQLTLTKTVQFENFKARGNVVLKQAFQYSVNTAQNSYEDLMCSVKRLSDEDCSQADKAKAAKDKFNANIEAIETIREILAPGAMIQSDIVTAAQEMGVSRQKILKALKDHDASNDNFPEEFHCWSSTKTALKNRKEYTLKKLPDLWESNDNE